MPIKLLALNCALKPMGGSSMEHLLRLVLREFGPSLAECELLRIAEWAIAPGVSSDEGEGDEWPVIRSKIVGSDILLIGTPILRGQPSSIAKRVLERMDAFLSETDGRGHTPAYGKVANVLAVGHEDGAMRVSAELFQALADVGYSIPAGGACYWADNAIGMEPPSVPRTVTMAGRRLARNTLHLATLLKKNGYPGLQ